jgi:hypothetical protein
MTGMKFEQILVFEGLCSMDLGGLSLVMISYQPCIRNVLWTRILQKWQDNAMQPTFHNICGWLHFQLSSFCKDKDATTCGWIRKIKTLPSYNKRAKKCQQSVTVELQISSCKANLYKQSWLHAVSVALFTHFHILAAPFSYYSSYKCASFVYVKLYWCILFCNIFINH